MSKPVESSAGGRLRGTKPPKLSMLGGERKCMHEQARQHTRCWFECVVECAGSKDNSAHYATFRCSLFALRAVGVPPCVLTGAVLPVRAV